MLSGYRGQRTASTTANGTDSGGADSQRPHTAPRVWRPGRRNLKPAGHAHAIIMGASPALESDMPPTPNAGPMARVAVIALLPGLLVSCATLSPEECRLADWAQIGLTDAAQGHERSRLAAHRESCAETGVAPATQAYLQGYELGLPDYCTAQTGFGLAARGRGRPAQCADERFPDFERGYRRGSGKYQLLQRIETLTQESRDLEQESQGLDQALQDNARALADPGLDPAQRRRLQQTRESLQALQGRHRLTRQTLAAKIRGLRQEAAGLQP